MALCGHTGHGGQHRPWLQHGHDVLFLINCLRIYYTELKFEHANFIAQLSRQLEHHAKFPKQNQANVSMRENADMKVHA